MLPATSYRDDAYGGDAVRRLAFVKEMLEGTHEHSGNGVTIGRRTNDELFNALRQQA